MNVEEALKSTFKQLLGNKARTILTMMGMFIGIGSVIMILALGSGLTDKLMGSFSEMGLGVFTISVKENKMENYITPEEVALLEEMPEVKLIVAGDNAQGIVSDKKGKTYNCQITGVEPEYTNEISKQTILYGRNFTEKDEKGGSRGILIAASAAKALFNDEKDLSKVIGENLEITVEGQPTSFEVIGIYDGKDGSNLSKKDLERSVGYQTFYISYRSLTQITGMEGKISTIAGITYDEYDQVAVTTKMGQILNRRHHLIDGYNINTFSMIVDMTKEIMNIVTLFISAIASISLVVGGVGIMNIMLVTVKERTKEIGIRKALGASNKGILLQFLIEALVITLLAGLIGMLVGYIGAYMVGGMIDVKARFSLGMLIFSTLTSITIGIIFGVYPAYQAARLDPVEALRAE